MDRLRAAVIRATLRTRSRALAANELDKMDEHAIEGVRQYVRDFPDLAIKRIDAYPDYNPEIELAVYVPYELNPFALVNELELAYPEFEYRWESSPWPYNYRTCCVHFRQREDCSQREDCKNLSVE
jgi:hypothetical protein